MGEVWLGKHHLLARLRADVVRQAGSEKLKKRFQREAQVTANLKSPHTVHLYDFGISKTGSFYYVMELLSGMDLSEMVSRFGPPHLVLTHHVQTKPKPPSQLCEVEIPDSLERVIMRCLEKNREDRPSCASELWEELGKIECRAAWTQERAQVWWRNHAADALRDRS